jgi:beta-lactamase class A
MSVTRRQCLVLLSATACVTKEDSLLATWKKIVRQTDGEVGAAALHLASGRAVSLNGTHRFPLASVCKFPIAAHILAMVDEGKFGLEQLIEIGPSDVTRSVSGVGERWSGQPRLPLNELLRVMVVQSDNTAVETLFRIGGGASALAARFRKWRLTGIRIDRSEMQCNLDSGGIVGYPPRSEWNDRTFDELLAQKLDAAKRSRAFQTFLSDPRDTGTPEGTAAFLARAFRGELLSRATTARLIEILRGTVTGAGRLKGLLPPGTVVGHKTGTTGTVNGVTGATNDSGVITLPEGKGLLAVAVYVKASARDVAIRERVIAEIARAAYDAFLM